MALKLFSMIVLLSALGCGKSPLLNHVNADDVKSDAFFESAEKPKCQFLFEKKKACAALSWTKKPNNDEAGEVLIKFFDLGGNETDGPYIDIQEQVQMVLWMPSMGHGSSPVKVSKLTDKDGAAVAGHYRGENVYFSMPGLWEVWIKLKVESNVIDQAKIEIRI